MNKITQSSYSLSDERTQPFDIISFDCLAELSFFNSTMPDFVIDSFREEPDNPARTAICRYFFRIKNKVFINKEQLQSFSLYKDGSFNFLTMEGGFRYIVDNIDVLSLYSNGECVTGFLKSDKGFFQFCTTENGFRLIVDGEDVLQKFNDGEKVIHCYLCDDGSLTLRTEKNGFKLIINNKDVFPFFTNGENVYSFSREHPEFIVITTVSGKVIKVSKELIKNTAGDNLITE